MKQFLHVLKKESKRQTAGKRVKQLNQEVLQDQQIGENLTMQERNHSFAQQETGAELTTCGKPTTEKILTDHVSVVKELSTRVDITGKFVLGTWHTASLCRWEKHPGCSWSCDHPESGW